MPSILNATHDPSMVILTEHTFKRIGSLKLDADILLPSNQSLGKPIPVIVWWHGGGLLQGSRKGIPPHLKEAPDKYEVCVVSADYRLAPQTRLPSIISDVADVVRWIHSSHFREITNNISDPKRVFLSGSSAGGWLALLAGSGLGFKACNIEQPPTPLAILAIYPITDILDRFWNTKQHPVSYLHGRLIDGNKELGQYLDPTGPAVTFSNDNSDRSQFYHYMIQEALLPSLLLDGTGVSPGSFSVASAIASGEVELPPTFIIHGSIDDKVPLRQAVDVADALNKRNLSVELVIKEGRDHLYDQNPDEDMHELYSFLKKHI